MKFVKIAVATTALLGLAATASAQDTGAYVAVGVDAIEFDAYSIAAKVGYNFTDYFGVEGQGSFGIIDDSVDGVDIGIDTSFGAFGVLRLPTSENFDLFARAGYHFTEISGSDGGISVGIDTDGFALGAGGTYWWDAVNGIRVEYTYFDLGFDDDISDESTSADVFTVSYTRKF